MCLVFTRHINEDFNISGAAMDDQNDNQETPLLRAVLFGNTKLVCYFLDCGSNLFVLWNASSNALEELSDTLLYNTCLNEKIPLINIATYYGYTDIMDLLLSKIGCEALEMSNESVTNEVTKTPLFFAVYRKHYEATQLLLDCGCEVNR